MEKTNKYLPIIGLLIKLHRSIRGFKASGIDTLEKVLVGSLEGFVSQEEMESQNDISLFLKRYPGQNAKEVLKKISYYYYMYLTNWRRCKGLELLISPEDREDDITRVITQFIIAIAQELPSHVCMEAARRQISLKDRPGMEEMEEYIRNFYIPTVLEEVEVDYKAIEELKVLRYSETSLVFEDLVYLNESSMIDLIKDISNDKLLISLKGCHYGMKNKIFSVISAKARSLLDSDLKSMGKVRKSDVKYARKLILDLYEEKLKTSKILPIDKTPDSEYV